MKINQPVTWAGFLITIVGSILFSTKAIIVKVAFANTSMDALTLLMLRMTFSLPFYLGAIWFARQENLTPLTARQWMGVVGLGVFGYYLSSLFDFIGLQYVTAGLERLILFLYPTFAVFINAFVFKQPVVRTQKVALLLTYTGIAIAYFGELHIGDMGNPHFIWGSFLIFLCSITYSIYIVGSGRMIPTVGVTRFTAYAMLSSTAGVFAHFAFGGGSWQLLKEAGTHIWYGILLAVVATVLPTFLLSNGMKRIGSNNVAIISAIGPVSTIIQAHFVLGEKIFPAQIAGTLLVIIGVVLIGWKRK
ncbi:DMT family transporter [Niastella caeni]|uniref:DMT family transporter n=1 Tax=Niastella caeni TaxID=2569763 RepID=A0A4S8HRM2_9BACT|nr:DMT family transporter [Niastella caeni]THU38090.1 DMT family transporter [Niastella caeni]